MFKKKRGGREGRKICDRDCYLVYKFKTFILYLVFDRRVC